MFFGIQPPMKPGPQGAEYCNPADPAKIPRFEASVPFRMEGQWFVQVGTVVCSCLFLLPWSTKDDVARGMAFIKELNELDTILATVSWQVLSGLPISHPPTK